jgi:NADPH:quinone reductase-like Zn-dependent oxidoreductase
MKAVTFHRYGKADALELREVEQPVPGDGEVLVKVRAVAINDWDWQSLQGIPFANRVTFGLRKPKKHILGSDIAGRVEAVGQHVTRFRPGDDVLGDLSGRWGGFAEYVSAPEDALTPKPAGMAFEEAAAIPQAGVLAVQGLIDHGRIQRGQKLLINGAGGGVGTLGVQIAKTRGAEVTGVDSGAKLEMLRSLGFDHVIDYEREDFTKSERRYDLILDVKTNRSPLAYLRVLAPGGAYVTVGGSTGRILQAVLLGPLISAFTTKRVKVVILKANKDLAFLADLFAAGGLRPVIDGHYTLAETPDAMRYFGEGKQKGKVVITVEEEREVRHEGRRVRTG